MRLRGWGQDCIYRQHGGTTSKMPALLGFLQNFQVLLAERIPRIFLQLQIRNSGRETIQMIPFRIWKMLPCLSPTSYLYTYYLCWEMFLWLLEHSPLFHAPSAVMSWKPGKGGDRRGLGAVGDGPVHHLGLWSCPPKACQDTGKEWLNMPLSALGNVECGIVIPKKVLELLQWNKH